MEEENRKGKRARECFTSEQLSQSIPRPMINFLWYLWYTYHDPEESEFQVSVKTADDHDGLHFTVHSTGISTIQDFGSQIEAAIVIRQAGERCFMEYYTTTANR